MNSNSLHFIVFLSRKMVTADVAVPFFVALNANNACKVTFITFDKQTAEQITENQLLYSAIKSIGQLIYMPTQRHNGSRLIVTKVLVITKLLCFFFEKVLRKKTFFLHFKQLNDGALYWFGKFFENKTIFMQSGKSASNQKVDEHIKERKTRTKIVCGKTVLFFDETIFENYSINRKKQRCIQIPFTTSLKGWLDYRDTILTQYSLNNNSSRAVAIILSSMEIDWLDRPILDDANFYSLFDRTLRIIREEFANYRVLIKLHPATETATRVKIDEVIKRHNHDGSIEITALSPSLLVAIVDFVVANIVSTTFQTFKFFKVPTIEFTAYHPEILKLTNQQSFQPELVDYFVNNSDQEFQRVLKCLPKKKLRDNSVPTELPDLKLTI